MSTQQTTIGRNIRLILDRLRWQQADLARRCHLSEATISRIISGEQPNPTAKTLHALAVALGCPVSQLLADPANSKNEFDAGEGTLLAIFRMLPPVERSKVVEYAEAIAIKRERDEFLSRHPEMSRRRTDSPPLVQWAERVAEGQRQPTS